MSENILGPRRFRLRLEEEEVVLDGVDGYERKIIIREMDGAAQEEFNKRQGGKMNFNKQGEFASFKSFDGMQTDLLVKCLFTEDGDPVPLKEIATWPTRTLSDLNEIALKLNGMNKGAEEEAKNE